MKALFSFCVAIAVVFADAKYISAVGVAGNGFFGAYEAGVLDYLAAQNYIDVNTKLSGSSSGALAIGAFCSGVNSTVYLGILATTLVTCAQTPGFCLGTFGAINGNIYNQLTANTPDTTSATCANVFIHVSNTTGNCNGVIPYGIDDPNGATFTGFTSRSQLLQACQASSYIPGFSGLTCGIPYTNDDGRLYVDGGFTSDLPCPPNSKCLRVTGQIPSSWNQRYVADIFPGLSGQLDVPKSIFVDAQVGNIDPFVIAPYLFTLYATGRADAAFYMANLYTDPLTYYNTPTQSPSLELGSNTDVCFALLFQVQNCSSDPATLSAACCAVYRQAIQAPNFCQCNPLVLQSSGATVAQLLDLTVLCNPPPDFETCPTLAKTYSGGTCPYSDEVMDDNRVEVALAAVQWIGSYAAATQCFNHTAFTSQAASYFSPGVVLQADFGWGTYSGVTEVAEILAALFSSQVNNRLARWTFGVSSSTVTFAFSADGSSLSMDASGVKASFLGDCYTALGSGVLALNFQFDKCSLLITKISLPQASSLTSRVSTLLVGATNALVYANVFDELDYKAICRIHLKYCSGTIDQQFRRLTDCLDYLHTLPRVSKRCGQSNPAGGNSQTCRMKYSFMVPLNPHIHCWHIGKNTRPDPNGEFKCHDEIDCVNQPLSNAGLLSVKSIPPVAQQCANLQNPYVRGTAYQYANVCH